MKYENQRGGDVHATDHMKQTALHWAAVRGSVAVADVLLQNGAPVQASDINGYRAVHIAAQYGQTGFLNFIVAKFHAEFDVPDNDGRSPLHWHKVVIVEGNYLFLEEGAWKGISSIFDEKCAAPARPPPTWSSLAEPPCA